MYSWGVYCPRQDSLVKVGIMFALCCPTGSYPHVKSVKTDQLQSFGPVNPVGTVSGARLDGEFGFGAGAAPAHLSTAPVQLWLADVKDELPSDNEAPEGALVELSREGGGRAADTSHWNEIRHKVNLDDTQPLKNHFLR